MVDQLFFSNSILERVNLSELSLGFGTDNTPLWSLCLPPHQAYFLPPYSPPASDPQMSTMLSRGLMFSCAQSSAIQSVALGLALTCKLLLPCSEVSRNEVENELMNE